ncbi:hypothetical protein ABZP36_013124 [Zizania latifolia]
MPTAAAGKGRGRGERTCRGGRCSGWRTSPTPRPGAAAPLPGRSGQTAAARGRCRQSSPRMRRVTTTGVELRRAAARVVVAAAAAAVSLARNPFLFWKPGSLGELASLARHEKPVT